MEPALRPSVAAGLYCTDDHQVDPRLVMAALRAAYVAAAAFCSSIAPSRAWTLKAAGCRIGHGEGSCRAPTVVLTAGAWTGDLLPPNLTVPVRPLKGQALAVRTTPDTGTLAHIVWTEQIHMAPRSDGRLIVGATVEERGFDDAITAGGLFALLEGAHRAFPAIEEMAIEACGPASGQAPSTTRRSSGRRRSPAWRSPPAIIAMAICWRPQRRLPWRR